MRFFRTNSTVSSSAAFQATAFSLSHSLPTLGSICLSHHPILLSQTLSSSFRRSYQTLFVYHSPISNFRQTVFCSFLISAMAERDVVCLCTSERRSSNTFQILRGVCGGVRERDGGSVTRLGDILDLRQFL